MSNLLTQDVYEIVLSAMEGLCCPRSLTIAIMVRENMWTELLQLPCHPSDYDSAAAYRRAAGATKLLSKLECEVPGLDPEAKALSTWYDAERRCYKTNVYLTSTYGLGIVPEADRPLGDFLLSVKKWMSWLLGRCPSEVEVKFGPGATISDKTGFTTVAHKMSSIPTFTPEALFHLVPWTGTQWAKATAKRQELPICERGNYYFQVNKTAMTKRSCAKEPSINAAFQRGVGSLMARRLRDKGLVISPIHNPFYELLGITAVEGYDNAKEAHVRKAQEASVSNHFATIDLSSASDTISKELVKFLLPTQWFELLDSLRSHYTNVKGKWVYLEKFSSMGNGFTFELETALFAAICLSIDPTLRLGVDLMVFGDDIVVPRSIARTVVAALRCLGFEINETKTFISSDFKESCGGDFYRGEPVRPHFIKELPSEPQDYIALANGIHRMACQDPGYDHLRDDLRRAWFRVLDCIPQPIRRCRGPAIFGDLVIHDDERYWQYRTRSNCIRYLRVYRPLRPNLVLFDRFCPDVQFAAALYGVRFLEARSPEVGRKKPREFRDGRHLPMRGPVSGYKVGWVPYS